MVHHTIHLVSIKKRSIETKRSDMKSIGKKNSESVRELRELRDRVTPERGVEFFTTNDFTT